jgi:toxin ParE1/3/4
MKPLVRRARADFVVEEVIAYYLENAHEVTLVFVDALKQAYRHIQRKPGTVSPRYAHELNLHGLRFPSCKRFP